MAEQLTRSFLSYVAEDLLARFGANLAHVAVVFPNKRAALFLNQELARRAGHAIWSPAYLTISELFRSQTTWQVADPIKAVCDLHRTYADVTGSAETLDRFYGWGQLLLADFDDIDKNMAEASLVFRNLTDLHEMDDISYLTPAQRELIARFFANFSAEDANSRLRQRFLQMWSRLGDIYEAYRERLAAQGLAYEGMLYRKVAEAPTLNLTYEHYVFVGFNVLQQVEQSLFTRLRREGRASFYWNFDHYYASPTPSLSAPASSPVRNEAGVYIQQWLEKFPNALDNKRTDIYDNLTRDKHINFVAAPTEDIQARYVTTWLREGERWKDGARTAIVLADEALLGTVVHCIPPEVQEVNITTGYPLSQTPIASLVALLVTAQLHGYRKDRGTYRLREVNGVLRHPFAKMLFAEADALHAQLNKNHRFYPKTSEVPFLALPAGDDYVEQLCHWLLRCVESVGKSDRRPTTDPLFEESVFRMFTLLSRLHDLIAQGDLRVDETTFQRLMSQLVKSTTIPYHGKPAIGVQIMGVLETRNLDFDHVLVLSCNDGNLPRGVDDASFIPHALRKAYGLTTIDNKVAIYSYYFHSLLQRAKDVTLVYNTSPDGKGRGAMSRFMLQLLTELPLPIAQTALHADQQALTTLITPQEQTESIGRKLQTFEKLSPSGLITYVKCGKMFFYKYIIGLREEDEEDEDTIDQRVFGNIFHRAAQLTYETLLPRDQIDKEDISRLLKQEGGLDEVIAQAINEELFHLQKAAAKAPELNGLQLISREVIEKYLRRLLQRDLELAPLQVITHESKVSGPPFKIGDHEVRIEGRIDRLDRINIGRADECLRVVDYKTGSKPAKDVGSVEAIFDPDNFERAHSDYILQAMAYSLIVAEHMPSLNPNRLPVRPALFFVQMAGTAEYDPTLTIGKKQIASVVDYKEDFEKQVVARLTSLFNKDEAFLPTDLQKTCAKCPYSAICGEMRA